MPHMTTQRSKFTLVGLALLSLCALFAISFQRRSPDELEPSPTPVPIAHESKPSDSRLPLAAAPRIERSTAPEAQLGGLHLGTARVNSRPNGRIHGRVLASSNAPVGGVQVVLYRGQQRREALAQPDGRFQFLGLERGQYRLFVDEASLPEEFLAPWLQGRASAYTGTATGIHGTSVRLSKDDELSVDLRVFESSFVRGSVGGPQGEPIPAALVSMRSSSGVHLTARTSDQGFFEIDGVYPGNYLVQVHPDPDAFEYAGEAPLPIRFEIGAGETRQLPSLNFGAKGRVVRGRVVDSLGQGVAGVMLEAKPTENLLDPSTWRAVTDARGNFRLGRMPSIMVQVELTGPESIAATPTKVRVIELYGGEDVLDLGDWPVQVAQAYRVRGRVVVDANWARSEGLDRYSLELRVDGSTQRGERESPHWIDPSSGEFDWSCATPHASTTLIVTLASDGGDTHSREVRVQPNANEVEDVLLSFP